MAEGCDPRARPAMVPWYSGQRPVTSTPSDDPFGLCSGAPLQGRAQSALPSLPGVPTRSREEHAAPLTGSTDPSTEPATDGPEPRGIRPRPARDPPADADRARFRTRLPRVDQPPEHE